jgi:hypothetical protein
MVDLMVGNLMQQNKNVKVSQSSSLQEDKTKVFLYRNNGHGFMGSLNPLFSIYGDHYVIDSKGTHNCHALMVFI